MIPSYEANKEKWHAWFLDRFARQPKAMSAKDGHTFEAWSAGFHHGRQFERNHPRPPAAGFKAAAQENRP